MQIFLTGASGFIGGAVARRLIKDGHSVRAMSRSERSDEKIRAVHASIEPVRCSLGAVAAEHLQGCQGVVHSAAYVEQWGSRQDFWEANVTGTEQMLAAARAAGVRRFVHVGTEAALFYGEHMRDIDETEPYPPRRSPYLYSETKMEAEKRVLAANDPGANFATISVRPRMVWGPGDETILPEILQMIEAGSFLWIDGGRAKTSTSHIDNVVEGIVLALEKGRGGEAYFITDDEIHSFRDFLGGLVATQGVAVPEKSMPGGLVRFLARIIEGTWRLFRIRKAPPLTRFAADITSRDCTLRIDKAKRELGYAPVISVERGLAEMPKLAAQ